MIDHVSLHVSDHTKSKRFYTRVLKTIGYVPTSEGKGYTGFGARGKSDFWISEEGTRPEQMHIAFKAGTQKAVKEAYETAIQLGAKDNGPPGPRPNYALSYYAAYFLDPDGHNIEFVYHGKE